MELSTTMNAIIDNLSADRLREVLRAIYKDNKVTADAIKKHLLVPGKVMDGGNMKIAPEATTSRFMRCTNKGCNQEFDVTENKMGACNWHTDVVKINHDAGVWDEHYQEGNGEFDGFYDYQDDPDYASGWVWKCCNKSSDNKGCQRTMHKSNVNIVSRADAQVPGNKRKAGEQIPVVAKRRN